MLVLVQGMSAQEVDDEIEAFRWVADRVYATMLARGKYNWNRAWRPPSNITRDHPPYLLI